VVVGASVVVVGGSVVAVTVETDATTSTPAAKARRRFMGAPCQLAL